MSQTRKTRIVCISDTHNQTPKLPPGDVLIHAGDLTNQGSYSELKKTVEWLEKTDYEAKIVVAGNHDTTLDPPFFHSSTNKFKWPSPQDTDLCRSLLTSSSSITYLEHEAATIYLSKPQTCFKIFGSPYSAGRRGWAFQYWGEHEAEAQWASSAMEDADIVVTHTPAYGHCDVTGQGDRSGCPVLTRRLAQVRPAMHVCGHIHNARGAERVRWKNPSTTPPSAAHVPADPDSLVEATTQWTDPGAGNKKMALVDLTRKGWALDYSARSVTRHGLSDSLRERLLREPDAPVVDHQPGAATLLSTSPSSLGDGALCRASEAGVEREWRRKAGGAIECREACDVGRSVVDAHTIITTSTSSADRMETAMINAAFLGQRVENKASNTFNKPIVVDVELPVWEFDSER